MTFTICTVIDGTQRLFVELVLWAICAHRALPRTRFRPVVYFVGAAPDDLMDWLARNDVVVRQATMPVIGSPHCNRLAPLLDEFDTDYVIVTDADVFFVDDPSFLFSSAEAIRASPNNASNPPGYIFKRLLAEANIGRPYRPTLTPLQGVNGTRETHINNISAGVVALPTRVSRQFASVWKKWAEWLVQRPALLEQWRVNIDQVSFALASEELRTDVVFLPPQANLVLYLLEHVESVVAFHLSSAHVPLFAARFLPDRTLTLDRLLGDTPRAVQTLNACISEACNVIHRLPSTKPGSVTFLNPAWTRT